MRVTTYPSLLHFKRRLGALFCCAVFGLPGIHAAHGDPWYFIDSDISLGRMTRDQTAPVTFKIKNNTDKPLKIISAEASCRCSTLEDSPEEIPAHGVGTFKWVFSAARSEGVVTETVTVEAADGRAIFGTFSADIEKAPAKPKAVKPKS
jgi:hypothetical protein